MRLTATVGLVLSVLATGCVTTPHPTHPLLVACIFDVETQYSGRVDHSIPDPTQPSSYDPCSVAPVEYWTEDGLDARSICMAATTTRDQARTACNTYLDSMGVTVGAPVAGNPPLFPPPTGGQICPFPQIVDARVIGRSRDPGMTPNGCSDRTTLPLR